MRKLLFFCLIISALVGGPALSQVPTAMCYQGYVCSPSGNPLEGNLEFIFRLYDDSSGGMLLWEETDTLKVSKGQFHARLGVNSPLDPMDFSGQTLWFETMVDGHLLPTRQAVATVGYAFKAKNADEADHANTADTANVALNVSNPANNCLWQTDNTNVWRSPGNVGIGTTSPAYKLDIHSSNPLEALNWVVDSGTEVGSYVRFGTNNARGGLFLGNPSPGGIYPADEAALLQTTGGWQWNKQLNIMGNLGIGTTMFLNAGNPQLQIKAADNSNAAWIGLSSVDETSSIGMRSGMGGDGSLIAFQNNVGFGSVTGNGTTGFVERMRITSNGNVGIGTTSPSQKLQVDGNTIITGSMTANTYYGDGSHLTGIAGTTDNDWGISGVQISHNASLDGNDLRLVEVVNSGSARAIYARTNATKNTNAAIFGEANNDGGVGVYGYTGSLGASDGASVGVFGTAGNTGASTGGAAVGVFGRVASYQGTGSVPVGVFGEALATSGIARAIEGSVYSTSYQAAAIKAQAHATSGQAFGIEIGNESSGGRGLVIRMPGLNDWGIDCRGYATFTGGVSASSMNSYANTSRGYVSVYGALSTQPMVEDYGTARLDNGAVYVAFDQLFMETVSISEKHPPFILVQPNGVTGTLWVEIQSGGFIVHDPNGSSAPISYFIKAVRKGQEDARLQPLNTDYRVSIEEEGK